MSSRSLGQVKYEGVLNVNGKLLRRKIRKHLSGKPVSGKFTVTVWAGSKRLHAAKVRIGRPGVLKMVGGPRITLLDVDRVYPMTLKKLYAVERRVRIGVEWVRFDRTARGWHIVVKWRRNLSRLETVCLQAILGSDFRREAWNLARVMSGNRSREWNILFERKLR